MLWSRGVSLQAVVSELDQGILTERQCTQLVEQHEAAQDWLREQVKGLGAPPEDRQALHSTANTLKVRPDTVVMLLAHILHYELFTH